MGRLRQFGAIFYQLTRPLSYLRIKHADKWVYDWLAPIVLTAVTCVIIYFFIPVSDVVKGSGLIDSINGFIGNLPGFFIAGLAAVATFNKHDIDQLMDNPPTIEIMHHGYPLMIEMTRRRFLCVLFSYLTAVSIFLVLCTKIALAITVPSEWFIPAAWVGIVGFFFLLWQMILATVLGLYYLGERLHTPQ
ncbi:hypothetical protein [Vibrio pomeroyi]|uniref:hypothetical protein n=1 Tax=Vibrio pomeroyi TaxID=198832 RepID=UPI0035A6E520